MQQRFIRYCAVVLIPLMSLLNCPVQGYADAMPAANVSVKHKPVEKVPTGQRAIIKTEVADEFGIKEVRVYFKSFNTSEYSFIPLIAKNTGTFTGTLPAPGNNTYGYDYLILVLTNNDVVVTTQKFSVTVENNSAGDVTEDSDDPIQVFVESTQAQNKIIGFSDNCTINTVALTDRLGVIAGINNADLPAETSSQARFAGTINATKGISTSTVIIGSVVAAAVIGGVAASSGGGSDGESALTTETILGGWNVREVLPNGESFYFVIVFNNDGTYFSSTGTPGTWSLSGSTLRLNPSHNRYVWSGSVSGNSESFYLASRYTTVFFPDNGVSEIVNDRFRLKSTRSDSPYSNLSQSFNATPRREQQCIAFFHNSSFCQ